MDTFCIHNACKMRTNFSLVYISPCTFKCPIKITRQSSNSCDAGSHRCTDETTARLNCPETRWRTLCRSVRQLRYTTSATPTRRPPLPPPAPRNLPFATLLGSKETYLSLHNPTFDPLGWPLTGEWPSVREALFVKLLWPLVTLITASMGMRTISEGAYLHSGEGNLRPAACLDREIGALKGGDAITHRVSQIPGYATDI